ncbi:hypothetical protein D3C87_823380 [compost metagenome]
MRVGRICRELLDLGLIPSLFAHLLLLVKLLQLLLHLHRLLLQVLNIRIDRRSVHDLADIHPVLLRQLTQEPGFRRRVRVAQRVVSLEQLGNRGRRIHTETANGLHVGLDHALVRLRFVGVNLVLLDALVVIAFAALGFLRQNLDLSGGKRLIRCSLQIRGLGLGLPTGRSLAGRRNFGNLLNRGNLSGLVRGLRSEPPCLVARPVVCGGSLCDSFNRLVLCFSLRKRVVQCAVQVVRWVFHGFPWGNKKPPGGGWLGVAPDGVYQISSDGWVRPRTALGWLLVANLHQAVLLQMLPVLSAPGDHFARCHRLVRLDIAHDHRASSAGAFVFLGWDELERYRVLDVALSHCVTSALISLVAA